MHWSDGNCYLIITHIAWTSKKSVSLLFFFLSGFQVVVAVQFCSCEPDFLRLLRFNFWGATPTKPELAFTMDLMKLLHTLNLECQVAVKDFCSAIQTPVDDIISFPVLDSLKIMKLFSPSLLKIVILSILCQSDYIYSYTLLSFS